jgi:Ca2+-binding EF-hand superfamily protein
MGCSSSKSAVVTLTDEDIAFLTRSTRYSEREIREWYHGFQQDCPDGRLTKPKFIDIYQMFFNGGSAHQFCEHVYRTFDSDQDGYVHSGLGHSSPNSYTHHVLSSF